MDQYHWYPPHTTWTHALSNISGIGSTSYVSIHIKSLKMPNTFSAEVRLLVQYTSLHYLGLVNNTLVA